MTKPRARFLNAFLGAINRLGVFDFARAIRPNQLTVLNYHRIDDSARPGFDTFKPNVSATPAEFARQMDYVKSRYTVISCRELLAWLGGTGQLPPHAALITFDDGYYDNLSNAYPILKDRNLPAVIFLTTSFMGASSPFYWDLVAYSFFHTKHTRVVLPYYGDCEWNREAERDRIMLAWIETLKKLPEVEKRLAIQQITSLLNVSIPADAFAGLYLTWDQVREMSRNGIEFGTHTISHPILTRISLEQVRQELTESKLKIESEIAQPVISLAYPNGQVADFSDEVINVAHAVGIPLAFTLLPGPASYDAVRRAPLAIRRIYIGRSDVFPRFVAKLSGVARLGF